MTGHFPSPQTNPAGQFSVWDHFAATPPAAPDWFICGGKFQSPEPPDLAAFGLGAYSDKFNPLVAKFDSAANVREEDIRRAFDTAGIPAVPSAIRAALEFNTQTCSTKEMNGLRRLAAWAGAYASAIMHRRRDFGEEAELTIRDQYAILAPPVPAWFCRPDEFSPPAPPHYSDAGLPPESVRFEIHFRELIQNAGAAFMSERRILHFLESKGIPSSRELLSLIFDYSCACCFARERNGLARIAAWRYAYAENMLAARAPTTAFALKFSGDSHATKAKPAPAN